MAWIPYSINDCCPDLNPACDSVKPTVDFYTANPTSVLNNNGSINIVTRGLLTNYLVTWFDGTTQTLVNNAFRNDVPPGIHRITLTSTLNTDCTWEYIIRIGNFNDLQAELYYAGNFTQPVPSIAPIPNSIFAQNIGNVFYRWNINNILNAGNFNNNLLIQNGATLQLQLLVSGGVPNYNILWQDYNTYGNIPANMITPLTPAQAAVNQPQNVRPPIIVGPNNQNVVTIHCVPNNGNGWIRATITDNSNPQLTITFWVYVLMTPLP